MVTLGSFGTFDLGDVATDTGFTSPSFLTSGYSAEWNGASAFVFFNLNNEGNTEGLEFVNGANDGVSPVSAEGVFNNNGTYTVTAAPEPGTLSLLFTAAVGFGLLGIKKLSH
jgi:hypothetical protein